jgi:putative ABC transport system permease protein
VIKSIILVYFMNLLNNKLFVIVNVLGLSIGITACMLVYNYVAFHKRFDRMYPNEENMYRVITESYVDGRLADTYGVTMQFLGPELKQFSEVKNMTRMLAFETMLVYKDNKIFDRMGIWGVDSSFFDFFGFKMLSGNRSHALSEQNTAVLSESAAKKIFGTTEIVGKTIELGLGMFHDHPFPFKVTGVVEDPPINTHLKYDVLVSAVDPNSMAGKLTIFNGGDHTYYYPFFNTYVLLRNKESAKTLEAKLSGFLKKRIGTIMEKYGERKLYLQPLSKVHLGPKYKWGADMVINRGMRANEASEFAIRWISFFALILLMFSIFNFINLSLINYSKRGKELGVRKMVGARSGDFLLQFLVEAFILISIAAIVSIILLIIFKKMYYRYLGLPMEFSIFSSLYTYTYLAGVFLAVFLLKVILLYVIGSVMKLFYVRNRRSREVPLSKQLVILQFMGAFILVNITIILQGQLRFMLSKDLGYSRDNILTLEKYTSASGPKSASLDYLETFKNELKKFNAIQSVTLSSITPGYYHHSNQRAWLNPNEKISSNTIWIDRDYANVYGLKLLAGQSFTKPTNDEVMINEALMNAMGVKDPQSLIGKYLYIDDVMSHHISPGGKKIIGIFKNYYQEPLNKSIAPTKYHYADINRGYTSIRYNGNNHQAVLAYVRNTFQKFFPDDVFKPAFLNEFLDTQYKSDIQFKELINITTLLSLLIAGLGILGLVNYSIEVNRKATAVRRVLGSSIFNIIAFFLRKYLIFFAVAIVFSFPLTIFLVREMLNNYAYRIEVNYLFLFLTSLPILSIILLIVSLQVLKVGKERPIIALKAE